MNDITPVYGGRASVEFEQRRHRYLVTVPGICDQLFQPSVTSILKMKDKSEALVKWAVNCFESKAKWYLDKISDEPGVLTKELALAILEQSKNNFRDVKEEAADIGTAVHAALEQEIKARAGLCLSPTLPLESVEGLTQDMVDEANAAIFAGIKYFDSHRIKLVQSESPRWSPTHGYIGTGDLIAEIDGMLSVLDFKTGKRLYPEVFLQLAAYQVAYQEEFPGADIVQRVGLNVRRDGTLEDVVRGNGTLEFDFACFRALLTAWRWHEENVGYWSNKDHTFIKKPAPRIIGPLPCGS